MTLCWKAAAFAAVLFSAGCVTPVSVNPVGTTTGLGRDMALVGTWRDDAFRFDDRESITVAPVGDSGMTAFRVRLPDTPEEQGSFTLYAFSTATLGQNHFINARKVLLASDKRDEDAGWMPLYYTVKANGRSAKLYYLDSEKLAKTIESGALKGRVERKKDGAIDAITITADPAELDAFFTKPEAASLFQLLMRYRKVE